MHVHVEGELPGHRARAPWEMLLIFRMLTLLPPATLHESLENVESRVLTVTCCVLLL